MRILSFLFILLSSASVGFLSSGVYADCDPTYMGDAAQYLKNCAANPANAINPEQWGGGTTAVKTLIINVSKKVIEFGALFAIGAIVFSGIQYTTSYGDDEKVKKAKTTGIYAIIGLFLLLLAFPLVDIVINFVYGLGSTLQ